MSIIVDIVQVHFMLAKERHERERNQKEKPRVASFELSVCVVTPFA